MLDESSAYSQVANPLLILEPRFAGRATQGMLHQYWADEQLIGAVQNSDIDYLIWYAPWKLIRLQEGGILPMPKTCVFDIKNMSAEVQKYDAELMMSSEV